MGRRGREVGRFLINSSAVSAVSSDPDKGTEHRREPSRIWPDARASGGNGPGLVPRHPFYGAATVRDGIGESWSTGDWIREYLLPLIRLRACTTFFVAERGEQGSTSRADYDVSFEAFEDSVLDLYSAAERIPERSEHLLRE
jgi:hypothetical protein